ncbi:hypothetical protein DO021_21520 [Desulfobacter hydrogenophilus]|uniref:Integrase catalytic domain-containing protein n=1 Tax=Desulfobacter hydrogenophilus TaxID=2291 RepID=A0A328F675_9BACT|nr:hypothetical protein [Desulfobacter hydrogenophilus]NDY74463.1 transposase family protein [Desulfobacter hydrogenophilus]QBH14300.1 hypothetical protein EYB58_16085 [Desulfobacter hydrogenophilus]RAL99977.1 hypothetical protein DO021_21520 [Desulfobacter hydrogenophilus]
MGWVQEMSDRLAIAVNGERDRIISEYQSLTGKSRTTLYRIAKKNGFETGRRQRCDAGTTCLSDYQLQFVSTLMQSTARKVKGVIMPTSEALSIAEDNQVIPTGQISVERVSALLREREMNKAALDAPTPCIRMRSLHPNHVHVFDASICIQYYLKSGKGLGFMDERDFREKKPKNFAKIKERIFRMVLADHFTHHLYVKYYVTSGENALMTFDFLTSAWRGGHHEKNPFRGVPFFLLMDAGSANVAKGIMALLKSLEIEMPKNMPHNPRRQGSAENAQNLIETHFESRLHLEPATTVDELNAWCTDWLAHFNATRRHRRYGMSRTACWLKYIRQEHIRDLPDDEYLRDMFAEPEVTRTVGADNTISFRGEQYRLSHIDGIRPGLKVDVIMRPYHRPQVGVVCNGEEYLVQPVTLLDGGFSEDAVVIGEGFKSQPDTPAMRTRKANDNLAFGEEQKKGDLPFGGTLHVHGHHGDKVQAVPMPRRGTPITVDRDVEDRKIPIMELFRRLRDAGVTMTPALNSDLRAGLGLSVSVAQADEIITALCEDRHWQMGGMDERLEAVAN